MEDKGPDNSKGLFQKIQSMSVSERINLAVKASKEVRSILIRDPNKVVQMAVIQSPKITESEVLMIASSRQIHDDILRYIISNRDWIRNYQIKVALVNNPKTPLSSALRLVSSLNNKDLTLLAKSKAIPRVLVITAQRRLKEVKR